MIEESDNESNKEPGNESDNELNKKSDNEWIEEMFEEILEKREEGFVEDLKETFGLTTNWYDKNKFNKILTTIDSNNFNHKNKIGN